MGMVFFGVIAFAVMVSINAQITLLAVLPFIVVGVIANASTTAHRGVPPRQPQWTGIVTGFIGEFFGAVQAVKVATAEEGVIGHFKAINDERRIVSVQGPAVQRDPATRSSATPSTWAPA